MRRLATLLPALLVLLSASGAHAATGDLVLASRVGGFAGPGGDGDSAPAVMSPDGRFVAFSSSSDNLSGEDENAVANNVFVRDLQANTTTLVNRASGAGGQAASGDSGPFVAISAGGRYVAFASNAPNLSSEDGDATWDVFVRDLQANTTTLVSRATLGAAGDASSDGQLAISADGRYVAFESSAYNLSSGDNDSFRDVFVRDLENETTTLVSRASGGMDGGAGGDAESGTPSISSNGRFVAFLSHASNLSADDLDTTTDAFVRDLAEETTTLVSRASGAAGAAADEGAVGWLAISGDGRYAGFASAADNLSAVDNDADLNIFVRDLEANTTTLVSRASGADGAAADSGSGVVSLSADGGVVGFASYANNLSDADNDSVSNIFVRDMRTHETTLVSRASGPSGAGGDQNSVGPSLSADGRFAGFWSLADNLSDADREGVFDIFVRDVTGAPAGPLSPMPRTPSKPVVRCDGKRATIVGTQRRDRIRGTSRRDVIVARGGNDVIRALSGNDLVCAGAGRDVVYGGAGRDRLLGGTGRDRLVGGRGRDRLFGGPGKDAVRP